MSVVSWSASCQLGHLSPLCLVNTFVSSKLSGMPMNYLGWAKCIDHDKQQHWTFRTDYVFRDRFREKYVNSRVKTGDTFQISGINIRCLRRSVSHSHIGRYRMALVSQINIGYSSRMSLRYNLHIVDRKDFDKSIFPYLAPMTASREPASTFPLTANQSINQSINQVFMGAAKKHCPWYPSSSVKMSL